MSSFANMSCKICNGASHYFSSATILGKYEIKYYKCVNCGFIQTEEPYWLEESYLSPINIYDTGILSRNNKLAVISSTLLYLYFNKSAQYLDYAGGYGIFTRLMRDNGFDFLWNDAYAQNLVARGFNYDPQVNHEIELITSFESFEHFVCPLPEVEKMLQISSNILFTTELLPNPAALPAEWWYYGLEHGQHVSLYTQKSLQVLADKYGLNFYTNGRDLHLLTTRKMPKYLMRCLRKLSKFGLSFYVMCMMKSRTSEDMNKLISGIKIEA